MSGRVETVSVLRAAGDTDPGRQREVNEDRFHCDTWRRLFLVVDGVGGQAAGGKAADTAVRMLKARLERQSGPVARRLREAITDANNEIHRIAAQRSEWSGMACVLTAVVVEDERAIIGHVGDTRLYKARHGRIQKVTRDHSPVGEREDAHELSELEAMRHPRRNEVYRDVGSDRHDPDDPDFIDVEEIAFEPDAALLLCSDGLTDLIDSSAIGEIMARWAGQPQQVVRALIDAANGAGGKDNVTVVYVEGEQFAPAASALASPSAEITRRLHTARPGPAGTAPARNVAADGGARRGQGVRLATRLLLAIAIVLALARPGPRMPVPAAQLTAGSLDAGRIVVLSTQSIAAALHAAKRGTTIVVEPGEYRETLVLRSDVRLVSRIRHGAVVRLPGNASETDAAIVARDVTGAAVEGFRVIGDAATPLGTGVAVMNAQVSISGVVITGAARAAIHVDPGSDVSLLGNDIRDNPGAALAIQSGANATVSHNVFMRNGSAGGGRVMIVEEPGGPRFVSNVFVGMSPHALAESPEARAALARANWFLDAPAPRVIPVRPGTR